VIGCGLVGAATARELARRGARVVIYEACAPGRGTSGTTFAWVNSYDKRPRAYHDLNVAGIRAHAELQADGGSGRWFFQTGNLLWPGSAEETTRLESWGYRVLRLRAQEARSLEPDVRFPAGAGEILLLPDEGYVLPAVLLGRLLGEALDHDAELRCPARVEGIEPEGGGVRVRVAGGDSTVVDAVVSCAGRWSGLLLADAGCRVPLVDITRASPAIGLLAYTGPSAVRLSRVVTTPQLNVRPDGGGRLVLQALELDSDADPADPPSVDGPTGQEFARRLAALLRRGEYATVEAIRLGRRALPADGLSVVGHVDREARVYVVVTHSGVTLAPALARLAAAEVTTGAPEALLEEFRPGRFDA